MNYQFSIINFSKNIRNLDSYKSNMGKSKRNSANKIRKEEAIRNEIRELISRIEPDSEVYLFGSRARGTHKRNSDWDLLILVDGKVDWPRKEKLNNDLFEFELENNLDLNTIIRNKLYWKKDILIKQTPFYNNIQRERVAL
ncbi:MAG: nucleotidyltransferase domain-containing protein [Bacteroidetes bacterium]|nr:MAG: nucleotidyltransferase domain-containing protein [Bacteroidota bacterium]